ncbi:aminoglycoside 3'-phosphotransferase [Ktedonosporobacter rubrisoli]|uniref:Aminoglycoside 3'-phosphotransferase n=1 Tax=Ktedonosporobacter rubrisoli TaxID=2509675 RepID=A0A4P6JTH1_KTERU|nr:APH(3') family aminoglycoside O-phosphotransferase [Ktedonosporobacter rubrisoli]QBD78879.1 aminoglycoside 3'-phosphotransferase [Ktedonosporobacter rubrisoli]
MLLAGLPPALRALLESGASWQPITIGCSGASVFRIGDRYLKIAPHGAADSLCEEEERLQWLYGRLPVPEVYYYGRDAEREYLLMSEVVGTMACEEVFKTDMERLVVLMAQGLHMVHAVEIADCPFDQRLSIRLEEARRRMLAGQVDEEDFDEERRGLGVRQLYAQLLQARPASEDLVFTHGDFCLPNILIDREEMRVNGFIDLGRCGIADRYQDIALACRSLAFNLGPEWIPQFLDAYGLSSVEQDKVHFYQLLDEFF